MNTTWSGKYGPMLIAEIGGNHEGDFNYALELTKLAINSDVDVIKYQIYTGDSLVSRIENPVRNKHFKKFQLSKEQYIQLAEMCEEAGKKFMASVWNPEFMTWIDKYIPIYKIGSGDMTAYPILEKTAKTGKPIIISTGLSNLEEVKDAINFLQSCHEAYKSEDKLAILQCTSMYPISDNDAHLEVMNTYKREIGLPVGYSDHTVGAYALEIAFAMGASVLEFHFTDQREGKEFRDHKVSLIPSEVRDLQVKLQRIKQLKGDGRKRPLACEDDHLVTFRRAIYPKTDLKAGTTLEEHNLTYLRPNHGIDARKYREVVSKKLKVDVKAHQKLSFDMLE